MLSVTSYTSMGLENSCEGGAIWYRAISLLFPPRYLANYLTSTTATTTYTCSVFSPQFAESLGSQHRDEAYESGSHLRIFGGSSAPPENKWLSRLTDWGIGENTFLRV